MTPKTIWKFTVNIADQINIRMPKGSRPISVGVQFDQVQVWAIVDPTETEQETQVIFCRGTGHPFNGLEGKFLGTIMLADGGLVFHFFRHHRQEL